MNVGAAYAWHDLATTRAVVFPGFDETLSAEYAADTAQAFGEANYQFNAGRYLLQPFASFAYVSVGSDSLEKLGAPRHCWRGRTRPTSPTQQSAHAQQPTSTLDRLEVR